MRARLRAQALLTTESPLQLQHAVVQGNYQILETTGKIFGIILQAHVKMSMYIQIWHDVVHCDKVLGQGLFWTFQGEGVLA